MYIMIGIYVIHVQPELFAIVYDAPGSINTLKKTEKLSQTFILSRSFLYCKLGINNLLTPCTLNGIIFFAKHVINVATKYFPLNFPHEYGILFQKARFYMNSSYLNTCKDFYVIAVLITKYPIHQERALLAYTFLENAGLGFDRSDFLLKTKTDQKFFLCIQTRLNNSSITFTPTLYI